VRITQGAKGLFPPMNKVQEVRKLNELELARGIPLSASWHADYLKSPWIYAGGLPYDLTEGDVICVFSQYGEVEFIHLLRDKKTGKSTGSAFIKYEDARSCVLAVDNFNGIQVCRWQPPMALRSSLIYGFCLGVTVRRSLVGHYEWITRWNTSLQRRKGTRMTRNG
jgi:RNA-binding motif protein, X-linked 2